MTTQTQNPFIVNTTKIGLTVHISLNGKLFKKSCSSAVDANELFRLAVKTKENPSLDNIKAIRLLLNDRTRIAMKCGLEADNETGEIYLAGFNTPIPEKLVEIIKDYYDNNFPLTAIINFWKLLMINPDTRVRTSLFDFISVHDFVITDSGYFIAYKAVGKTAIGKTLQTINSQTLSDYVYNQWFHVKKDWKTNPAKYMIYRKLSDPVGTYLMTKKSTCDNWDEKALGIQFLGCLDSLYKDTQNIIPEVKLTNNVYTDKYTGKMHIQLGVPVIQKRGVCDADPGIECSHGLHVGSTKYVEHFAQNGDTILITYVNPANVIAVPDHDKSKIRVCEYFPYAEAEYVDGKINIIKQSYYESDYKTYEEKSLNDMVVNVQANQLPIEKAINVKVNEDRPMSELMVMIKDRLVVLSSVV